MVENTEQQDKFEKIVKITVVCLVVVTIFLFFLFEDPLLVIGLGALMFVVFLVAGMSICFFRPYLVVRNGNGKEKFGKILRTITVSLLALAIFLFFLIDDPLDALYLGTLIFAFFILVALFICIFKPYLCE